MPFIYRYSSLRYWQMLRRLAITKYEQGDSEYLSISILWTNELLNRQRQQRDRIIRQYPSRYTQLLQMSTCSLSLGLRFQVFRITGLLVKWRKLALTGDSFGSCDKVCVLGDYLMIWVDDNMHPREREGGLNLFVCSSYSMRNEIRGFVVVACGVRHLPIMRKPRIEAPC